VVETGPIKGDFFGAEAIGPQLAASYAALAEARGTAFLDAGQIIAASPIDGAHLDAAAHRRLGKAVAETVRAL